MDSWYNFSILEIYLMKINYLFRKVEMRIPDIEIKKEVSRRFQEARNISRPEKCLLCDRKLTKLCNSHSVPQFVLKHLSEDGKIMQSSLLMAFEDVDIFETEKGVKNSGTFKFICHSCDKEFFSDYESEDALLGEISDKMLAEIALKNELLNVSKRSQEVALYSSLPEKIIGIDDMIDLYSLDLRDFLQEVEVHKREILNNTKGAYQIIFKEILPFVVPIATQVAITLRVDMYGYPVNDVYNPDPKIKMQDLHLVIFPLKESSLVLAFYHKKDKKYRTLRHQFNSENSEKTKEFLNYLVFAYTENFFISKIICEKILSNKKLIQLSRELYQNPDFGRVSIFDIFNMNYKPVKADEIPNFLTKDWALGEKDE